MEPDKIPDVFGYKVFMILSDDMDSSIKYGDLIITKNIEPQKLQIGNVIAFRNPVDTVTIYKIKNITELQEQDPETNEEKTIKQFEMEAPENAIDSLKNIKEAKVEGIVVHRIPRIGLIVMWMQQPIILLIINGIILLIGGICYYIAYRLDKKELEEKEKTKV